MSTSDTQATKARRAEIARLEGIAKQIYEAMCWTVANPPFGGHTPDWQEGGNSFAQGRAREAARSIAAELSRLEAAVAAREGYVLVPVEQLEHWREGVLGHGAHWNYARLLEVADEIRLMIAACPTPAASDDWCAGRDAAVNWLTWLANHSKDDRKADLLGCAKRIGALIRPTPADSGEGKMEHDTLPINHEWLDVAEQRAQMAESVTLPIDQFLALIAVARHGLRPKHIHVNNGIRDRTSDDYDKCAKCGGQLLDANHLRSI